MKAITGEMILTSASTRVDGSLSLRFSTSELAVDEKVALLELQNQVLSVLLQPKNAEPVGLKEFKNKFEEKSPSARLRAVLFILWKETDGTGEFEEFYRRRMNSIIDKIKEKFPERTT